jgi:predicted transcriptional regulator
VEQPPLPPPVQPEVPPLGAPALGAPAPPAVEPFQKSLETMPRRPDTVAAAMAAQTPRDDEIEKGKSRATATAAKIRALLDENKTDEAMTVFQIYQMNMQRFLEARAYAGLKAAVETAFTRDRDERARAQGTSQTIERLLDQDRASEASAELSRSREILRQYLDKQEFRDLDSRVGTAVADAGRKQAAAQGLKRDLRGLLDAGKVEDAYVAFDKSRSDLERGLSKEEMAALKKDVAAAYNALQDKKKLSELCNRDIVSLIKAGKGSAAFARFMENRSLLQQYLEPKAFTVLEADANKANRGFLTSQERARSTLFKIDSLLAAGRIQAAYDLFEDVNVQLRRDLANDLRFFNTKGRLMKAYDTLKADKALAAQTARKIEYLDSRKEGRKADVQFQQDKARLQKFLEPSAFDKLDQSVRRAKSEYESNYAATRLTVATIEELLGGKKIEQAYKAYENAEDDLDFYFGDDKVIAALGKRVKDTYAGLQERRQWAISQVRQIKRLIEKNRGNQAYARFQETRAELAKYVDVKTLSSLDISVERANTGYEAARSRTETHAARIRSMIVQNQVEDAYAAFDTSESDLEFYLDPGAFSAIRTLVQKFNSALQDKKQEALRTTGTINRLIDRNLGDSAFALFRQNDAFLSQYLKGPTYKAVAVRAAHAKEDWEKNCRQAQALSARLKDLLERDRAEAVYGEFDDKRDYLDHYLDKVSFARLETSVRVPYEFFLQ